MALTAETTQVAAGLLKQAYSDDIAKVVPASSILQEEISFVPDSQREGAQFNCPVLLSLPSGFTYGAGYATYQAIIRFQRSVCVPDWFKHQPPRRHRQ